VDNVLSFTIAVTAKSDEVITNFMDQFIESADLQRKGITIGVDVGTVQKITLTKGQPEYFGRPINVTCRPQASLTKPEHVNKALLSQRCYSETSNPIFKRTCGETHRVLRNLSGDKEVKRYEFSPLNFRSRDTADLRRPSRALVGTNLTAAPTMRQEVEQAYSIAIASTTSFTVNIDKSPEK
jgi:hypothetical protein